MGISAVRTRDNRNLNNEERLENRKAILAALAKAIEGSPPLDETDADADYITKNDYYTLTQEEMEALLSGDIQKIENWSSSLDRQHAIWLLCRLIKENW